MPCMWKRNNISIKCRPASAMPRQRPTPAFRLVQYREEHTALFLGEAGMLFSDMVLTRASETRDNRFEGKFGVNDRVQPIL